MRRTHTGKHAKHPPPPPPPPLVMSKSLIVSNLPNRADASFLNVLFEGHVQDSIWGGYGPGRFAIVSFSDAAYPARVLEARAAFEAWRSDPTTQVKKKRQERAPPSKRQSSSTTSAVDDNVAELTVDELCETGEQSAPPPSQKKQPTAAAVGIELDPFFGELRSDFRVLFIAPSPISVAEVVATGCVPGRGDDDDERQREVVDGQKPSKRLRVERSAPDEQRRDRTMAAHKTEKRVDTTDVPQLERDAPQAEAVVAEASPSTTRPRREKKQKPPSRIVLDDDDDAAPGAVAKEGLRATLREGASAVAPPADARRVVAPTAVVEDAATSFARSSKDQCKFCGSELHLSRHCPDKKK